MKTITVLITCWNEEENVIPLTKEIINIFHSELKSYKFEIIFIDNCSNDLTRDKLYSLCEEYPEVKVILNAKNFGFFNSQFHGLLQTKGDCTILMCADFQDPVNMIPLFVKEWENGHQVVCGIKSTSKENHLIYFARSCYYKAIKMMSDTEQIEHFTGFGLYDSSFINVLVELHDPAPFLRGIVAEFAFNRKDIEYEQEKRRSGKSSFNLYKLYDAAMLSFTSYTKVGLRLCTFFGFLVSGLSITIAFAYLILKLMYWEDFSIGTAPILIGVFLMGGLQMFFTGLLGEYIMAMNTRILNRPLVIEERRLNFEE